MRNPACGWLICQKELTCLDIIMNVRDSEDGWESTLHWKMMLLPDERLSKDSSLARSVRASYHDSLWRSNGQLNSDVPNLHSAFYLRNDIESSLSA